MIRNVTVHENNFVLIFSDAVILYESAKECDNSDLNSALAKASVLSVCYAIEAAANSFLQSIEMTADLHKQLDRFSTIDKFDFVLQWHTGNCLESGSSHVQAVQGLIKNRNAMVHPKVVKKSISVETQIGPDGAAHHNFMRPVPKKGQQKKPRLLGADSELYTDKDAKAALQVMTNFLNVFVRQWGIGFEVAESFLFQHWDGSINARSVMFRKNQIEALIRNNDFLDIKFMGIYGMF